MKNVLKLAFAAIFAVAALPAMAQKFGTVNSQEVVMALPEVKEVQANLQKMSEEFALQMEEMQVEGNKKLDEYNKTRETLTENIRAIREQEINNISERIQQLQEDAQAALSAKQEELMKPLIEKARAAMEAVMKAKGLAGVMSTEVFLCTDPAQVIDITADVKTHLGV